MTAPTPAAHPSEGTSEDRLVELAARYPQLKDLDGQDPEKGIAALSDVLYRLRRDLDGCRE